MPFKTSASRLKGCGVLRTIIDWGVADPIERLCVGCLPLYKDSNATGEKLCQKNVCGTVAAL